MPASLADGSSRYINELRDCRDLKLYGATMRTGRREADDDAWPDSVRSGLIEQFEHAPFRCQDRFAADDYDFRYRQNMTLLAKNYDFCQTPKPDPDPIMT